MMLWANVDAAQNVPIDMSFIVKRRVMFLGITVAQRQASGTVGLAKPVIWAKIGFTRKCEHEIVQREQTLSREGEVRRAGQWEARRLKQSKNW